MSRVTSRLLFLFLCPLVIFSSGNTSALLFILGPLRVFRTYFPGCHWPLWPGDYYPRKIFFGLLSFCWPFGVCLSHILESKVDVLFWHPSFVRGFPWGFGSHWQFYPSYSETQGRRWLEVPLSLRGRVDRGDSQCCFWFIFSSIIHCLQTHSLGSP